MLVSFGFLLLVFSYVKDKGKRFSYASITWVMFTYVLTETLSLFKKINQTSLALCWGVFVFFLIVLLIILSRQNRIHISINIRNACDVAKNFPLHWIIGIITLLWAIGTIPYNWDSMTYQLTRVAHWAQNESIAHFVTANTRQIASPVLGSFINLHIYVLCGKRDLLCNLVQWSCYIANAWLIFRIAIKIGCNSKFAKVASLLFMSMPIAFAEALTTQVDHLATLWLLLFIYFLFDFIDVKEKILLNKENITGCLCMCFCVVFGYLTKPTVSIGMLLLAFGLLVVCIVRKDSVGVILRLLIIATPTIVVLIMPEILRNILTFHAFNPPNVGQRQIVGTMLPNYVFVNFLKNFTFNLPNIYVYRSSRIIYSLVSVFAKMLGVELNHPSISEDGKIFEVHSAATYGHDTAVNPIVLILAIVCIMWCIYRQIKKQQKGAKETYFVFGLFCIFCCIVRWEPFVSRYMLPYLSLFCPIIGLQMQDFSECHMGKAIKNVAVVFVYFFCIVDIFAMTWYHGGIMKGGWEDGNYVSRNEIADEYRGAIELIQENGSKRVGLRFITDDYEYPLWCLNREDVEFEHIGVLNDTTQYENENFLPDCILTTSGGKETCMYKNSEYKLSETSTDNMHLWVYVK